MNSKILGELIDRENYKLRIKPQEMIKFCDNLMDYQNQLINMEKENPDPAYVIDLNFRTKIYDVFKLYFVTLIYLTNRKYEDTYTMLHHLIEKLKDIEEFYDIHNLKKVTSLNSLFERVENIEKISKFLLSKVFVKVSKEKSNPASKNEGENNINNNNKKNRMRINTYMHDLINEKDLHLKKETFEVFKDNVQFTYEEYVDATMKNNYNNNSSIIHLPPNTHLLNPKPIVYDLAFPKFQYPDLKQKKQATEKSMIGRAFGYFFNK